jgi:hypothetical protein
VPFKLYGAMYPDPEVAIEKAGSNLKLGCCSGIGVYSASELYIINTLEGLRELLGISWNGTRLHPPFSFAERAGAPARACKPPGFRLGTRPPLGVGPTEVSKPRT